MAENAGETLPIAEGIGFSVVILSFVLRQRPHPCPLPGEREKS